MKSQPWGRKTPSASTHRPRRLSHPPRPRLHFRARVHTSPAQPSAPPRGAIGLPPQQLSTMGYPRKSYPHRCPPPCAKRSRSRACARVYINIVRPSAAPGKSPRRSGKESAPLCHRVPRRRAQGGGGRRQRQTPPRAVPNHAACVPNHCAKRRKCTRQTPPLPVRSPRGNLSTAAPPPADGQSAVRKGGSAQGQPRPCPCALPATACLRPRPCPLMGVAPCALPAATCLRPCPCPLMGEAPCAGWGRAKAKADAPSHSNPPLSVYRRAPAA